MKAFEGAWCHRNVWVGKLLANETKDTHRSRREGIHHVVKHHMRPTTTTEKQASPRWPLLHYHMLA